MKPKRLPLYVAALFVLSCLGLAGCASALRSIGGMMSEELRQNGVPATAEILEIWDTGWTINDNPVIGMKVRVQASDRPAFETRIEKTMVSRIAIPQFQPGRLVPIRFDPKDPTVIAVDFEGSVSSAPSSGNPYRNRFVRASPAGAVFLPPPSAPRLYLGTADSAADTQALLENDYALLGGSGVTNGSNPQQALDQGKEVGAALVVVYGHFIPPPGLALDILPFRPRLPDPDRPAIHADSRGMMLVSGLGLDDQFAAYWGKTRPAILGIVSRPLDDKEQTRLRRKDGIVVTTVANGSPAATARITVGDVIVAIDGKPLADARAVPALIASLAGQKVRIDLIRDGSPLSVMAQLNPASP
jgi:hypothetical protein